MLGCEPGTAQQEWFGGTRFAGRTCPRRLVIMHPDASAAVALWRACEGKPGIAALNDLSTHAVEAFAVIDEGRAAKVADEAKQRRSTAERPADGGPRRRGR